MRKSLCVFIKTEGETSRISLALLSWSGWFHPTPGGRGIGSYVAPVPPLLPFLHSPPQPCPLRTATSDFHTGKSIVQDSLLIFDLCTLVIGLCSLKLGPLVFRVIPLS